MANYSVHFKGMLFKAHYERFDRAGIDFKSSEPSMHIGPIKTGEPINTVVLEADSERHAVQAVKAVLIPDDANFTNWGADAI